MAIVVTSPPDTEPITLTEAKEWLRVSSTAEDTLITALIEAARHHVESHLNVALFDQEITEYYDVIPMGRYVELSVPPVSSVTSVQYRDSNGDYQTFDTANYYTDLSSRPGRVILKPSATWPTTGDYANVLKVVYQAGVDDTDNIARNVKVAMLLLIGFWYENREDMPANQTNNPKVRSANIILNNIKHFV